jgi:hypothetical protein
MKYPKIMVGVLVVLMGTLSAAPVLAKGGNAGNPGILPPHANAFGASYGEWAAEWMQWALGIGADENPVLDETGASCGVGQEGKVWFLAGTFGDTDVADVPLPQTFRECTIPTGKAIFFPVVNPFFFRTEPEEPTDPDEIQAMLLSWVTAEVYCEIDGVPVEDPEAFLTVSPVFDLTLPDDNVWAGYGLPGGTYGPAATAGYYLMLAPLSVGDHSVYIWVRDEWVDDSGAEPIPMRWGMDVTYDLRVVPRGRAGK